LYKSKKAKDRKEKFTNTAVSGKISQHSERSKFILLWPQEVSNLRNSSFTHFRFEVLTAVLLKI
jgi:hypothetical protein